MAVPLRLPCGLPLCQRESILKHRKLVVLVPALHDLSSQELAPGELLPQFFVLVAQCLDFGHALCSITAHWEAALALGDGWIPSGTMTIAKAMRMTGLSRKKIENLIHSGALTRVCPEFAGYVLIAHEDVERVTRQAGNSNGKQTPPPARRRNGPVSDRNVGIVEIVEDMTRADIVDSLQRLRLPYEESSCLLKLDRGCRDYIVTALRSR
jgi:hypothetical protein